MVLHALAGGGAACPRGVRASKAGTWKE